MKNGNTIFATKWITYTAMLTALTVATAAIPPAPTPWGNVYWCDGIIFLTAYLMDPFASFIVGGLGTLLYDMCFGNAAMAPVSLIIHGVQGAAVSVLLHCAFKGLAKKREPVWAGISSVAGAIAVIGGYFAFYCLIAPLIYPDKNYGYAYASVRVVRNVLQEVIGIAAALTVCYATTLKKQLAKSNLLPEFKKERGL